jgi:hypothetical protein
MKIAKPIITIHNLAYDEWLLSHEPDEVAPPQMIPLPDAITKSDVITNYKLVPDDYDFLNSGFEDKTTLTNLLYFYEDLYFDYISLRDYIKTNIVPNWTSLTFEDKKKITQLYCYPANITSEELLTYWTVDEQEAMWNEITIKTRNTRQTRLFAAFQKISYELTELQVASIYLTTKQYCIDFWFAKLPTLINWISNLPNPISQENFTNNGFAQMSGYSTKLKNDLLDILVNGNYKIFK